MRMAKGEPFIDTKADFCPEEWEGNKPPRTFSEAFLYPTVGKGDARFILGVAEEYAHIITALGPTAVKFILAVKPQLVQRLGIGKQLADLLEDAVDEQLLIREERMPSQVILDQDAAHDVWKLLHSEYRRHFDPEEDLDESLLRAYHTLTDGLSEWEQDERQKERDRLPEKKAKQEERREKLQQRQANRRAHADLIAKVIEDCKDKPNLDTAFVARQVEIALRQADLLPDS